MGGYLEVFMLPTHTTFFNRNMNSSFDVVFLLPRCVNFIDHEEQVQF